MGSAPGTVKAQPQPHDFQIYMYYVLSQIKQLPIKFFYVNWLTGITVMIDAPRQNTEWNDIRLISTTETIV